ncbi:MAG: hypothetical protein Q9191_008157, partial [Dirinaria sp. TL-2023a]
MSGNEPAVGLGWEPSSWESDDQRPKPSRWEDKLLGKRIVSLEPRCAHLEVYACIDPPVPDTDLPTHVAITMNIPANGSQTSNQACTLLELPAEIRNKIMQELFRDVSVKDWGRNVGVTPASIIFTCKQFYNETRNLAKEACTFRFEDLPWQHRLVAHGYVMICDLRDNR